MLQMDPTINKQSDSYCARRTVAHILAQLF